MKCISGKEAPDTWKKRCFSWLVALTHLQVVQQLFHLLQEMSGRTRRKASTMAGIPLSHMNRLGNRVNRVYPRDQSGGYAPSLNLARWLPRGCTDVFYIQNPKKTGYPTVSRKYKVFETHPGRTQRRFTRVKPVLPNPVLKSIINSFL